MGYDVHITRKAHWSDDAGQRIELAEWLSVIAADPELRHDGFAEAVVGGGAILRMEEQGIAVWRAHPENPDQAWITYSSGAGCIVVKNPDEAFLHKMIALAAPLGATVQGDDGEIYSLEEGVLRWSQPQ